MPGDKPMQPYPYKNGSGTTDAEFNTLQVDTVMTVGTPTANANETINGNLIVTGTITGGGGGGGGGNTGPNFTATDATLQYRVAGGIVFDLSQTNTGAPTFNLKNSAGVTTGSTLVTGAVNSTTSNGGTSFTNQTNTSVSASAESGFLGINDAGTSMSLLMSGSNNTNRGIVRTAAAAFGIDIDAKGISKSIKLMTNDVERARVEDTGVTVTGALTSSGPVTSSASGDQLVASAGTTFDLKQTNSLAPTFNLKNSAGVTSFSTLNVGSVAANTLATTSTGVIGGALTVAGATTVAGVLTASGISNLNGAVVMGGAATTTGIFNSLGVSNFTGLVTANGGVVVPIGGIAIGAGGVAVAAGGVSVAAGSLGVTLGNISVGVGSITANGPGGIITGIDLVANTYAGNDGTIRADGTQNPTSFITPGAIQIPNGGLNVKKDAWVGGDVHVAGTIFGAVSGSNSLTNVTLTNTTGNDVRVLSTNDSASNTDTTASIATAGGIAVAKTVQAQSVGLTGPGSFISIGPQSTNDVYIEYGASNAPGAAAGTLHFTTPFNGADLVDITPTGNVIANQGYFKGTQLQSTVVTGTPPLVVSSSTNVTNLNASSLNGATMAAPGTIGGTTPSPGTFTTTTCGLSISGNPGPGWYTPTIGVSSSTALFTAIGSGSSSINIAPQGGPSQTNAYIETSDYTNTNAATLRFTGPSGVQPMLTIAPTTSTFPADLHVLGTLYAGSVVGTTTYTGVTAPFMQLTNTTGNELSMVSTADSASRTDTTASLYTLGGISAAKSIHAGYMAIEPAGTAVMSMTSGGVANAAYSAYHTSYGNMYMGVDGNGLTGTTNRGLLYTNGGVNYIDVAPNGVQVASFNQATGTILTGNASVSGATTLSGGLTAATTGLFQFSSTNTLAGLNTAAFFQSSQAAGTYSGMYLGRDLGNTNNCGSIRFGYVGSGSASNFIEIDANVVGVGANNGLRIDTTGRVDVSSLYSAGTLSASTYMNGSLNVTPTTGTWTPTLANTSTGGSGFNMITARGSFSAIGNYYTYYFYMQFTWGVYSSTAYSPIMRGLPYLPVGYTMGGGMNNWVSSFDSQSKPYSIGMNNTPEIVFFTANGNGAQIVTPANALFTPQVNTLSGSFTITG